MDRMEFVQGVVRTRVMEKRLLNKLTVERMIEAADVDEVFKILNETEYSVSMEGISKYEDYEKILTRELERVYTLMRDVTVEDIVVDLLALKYDYHNLKVIFKENELKEDLSSLYVNIGTVDFESLKEFFRIGDFKDLPIEFQKALEDVKEVFEETEDPQRIDLVLDRHYFNHLYNMAASTKIELFIDYVRDLIDFTNIRSAIRLSKQRKDFNFFQEVILPNGNIDSDEILNSLNETPDEMIDKFKNSRISKELRNGLEAYKETGRLSDLERYMDDYLMGMNKNSKYINFGPEPIFSYIYAKETEIKILRIIIVSKLNNISSESTRRRVRDLYV